MKHTIFNFDSPDPYIEYSIGTRTKRLELVYVEGILTQTDEPIFTYIIDEHDPEIPPHVMESIDEQASEYNVTIYPRSSLRNIRKIQVA
jgi:hypothetical protein